MQLLQPSLQAFGAQAQLIDILKCGLQLPPAGQSAALFVDIFLHIGVHGAESLAAPLDCLADAFADEMGRHIAQVVCHGRFPIRLQLVQSALQLVGQGRVALHRQAFVGKYPVIAQCQGGKGDRPPGDD